MKKENIRLFFAVVIIGAGVITSLYIGGWVMFIKPILEACRAYDAGVLTGSLIGMTLLKCILAGYVAALIFCATYLLGFVIASYSPKRRKSQKQKGAKKKDSDKGESKQCSIKKKEK